MSNAEEPLTDEEFRATMTEFALVLDLRRRLEEAHKYIAHLRKELKEQTAIKVAEMAFGYEADKPKAPSWTHADHLPPVDLFRLTKTNTRVLEVSTWVDDELKFICHDRHRLDEQIKSKMMCELFCEMQKSGLFRSFQRKVEHETIYTIGIEVAKP